MILEDNLSFRIGRGILTGLQDALGISQLSAAASALLAELGISLVASAVIMPAAVVSVIGVIMGIIGVVSSAFTAVAAAGGIYSIAMGKGNKYDNAEDYAHDVTMLVVSMFTIWGSAVMIKNNLAMFKSATQNLAGRTTRPTVSEVVGSSKSAKMISSLDDFLDYTKGFLDEDALQYAKEVLGNDGDDTAKLKKVAQLIEDGSGKIGKKLSKSELKAGLDVLWNDAGVEGALAAIESLSKGGTKLRNGYEFGKLSVEPEDLLKKAEKAAGSKKDDVNALDGSRFSKVKDIDSFLESIPADSSQEPWVPDDKISGGMDRYVWTDESGNKWFAECHGPDSSVAPGNNASTGWVYRVKVKIKGKGKPFYMATDGKFYSEKMLTEGKECYIETLINDTHIPIYGRE